MRILLRNWHLKLSAVLLATVLYTGLVFSGQFSESSIQVRVEQANVPPNSFVLSGDVGFVEVTYRTTTELAPSVTAAAFVARVDLSGYDMDRAPEPQVLEIEVNPVSEGIEVTAVEPSSVRVELDRVESRTVPVEVDTGTIPDGIEIDDPVVSHGEVQVRGPASVVDRVDHALAPIAIQTAALDFNEPVNLVAVDIEGQPVDAGRIDIEPETVSVQVDVRFTETTQTVPVRPDISGTPAAGFALETLSIEPSLVTLRGLPGALAGVSEVLTEPLSIAGASGDQTFEVELVLPADVRLADEAETTSVITVTAGIVPSVSSRTFVVGIVCEGAGTNACLPAIDQVTLTLSGPGGALSGLAATDVTPTLDVSGLAPGTYDVQPMIGALPDGVELLALTPGTISVTIEAPATPTPTPAP